MSPIFWPFPVKWRRRTPYNMYPKPLPNPWFTKVDFLVSDDKPKAPKAALQFPGQAPSSPDYVPGPEHPPLPKYIPGLEYPKYLIPSDDEVPIKDQPVSTDASPTTLSPGYAVNSDPKKDPEEDLEEDPADYPVDGGDDDDDKKKMEDEASEEDEEKEHLALTDSTTLPIIDPVPLAEQTQAFETNEFATTPLSPPTHTSPTYADAPLGYRVAMIRSRAASPPLVPSPKLRRDRISKRLCLTAPALTFKVKESSAAAARYPGSNVTHVTNYSFVNIVDATPGRLMSKEVGYGIADVWDDMVEDMKERAPNTLVELSQRVTDLAATLARDTYEMRYHLYTAMLLESQAPEVAPQSPGQAPPSPDYVPGPEHPPSPKYIPGPEYPKYLVPSDDEVPIKDQPVPTNASPTSLSPGYAVDSDPKKELEEDPEEDPEEHLAPTNSTTLPVVDPVPLAEQTQAFETNESSLTPPSPPTHTSPTYVDAPLGYRVAMIRSRVASPPLIHSPPLTLSSPPPLTLPAPSSPLPLPAIYHRKDVPEANVPPQKRLCLTALTLREFGYGIADVWDDMVGDMKDRAPNILEELSQRVTDLAATLAQDTHEMRYYIDTSMLLESDVRQAQQAWSQAMTVKRRYMHEQISVLQGQRIEDSEILSQHIQQGHDRTREPELARDPEPQDIPANAGCMDLLSSFSYLKMSPKRTTTTTHMTDAAIKAIITQGVADALAEYEAYRSSGNGDDSHDSGSGRRIEHATCNNCTIVYQIKFATYTLLRNVLTWWNFHIKTVGHDTAYGIPWKTLKKMVTDKYYPRAEIKKLEIKVCNLKVKGTDVLSYNQRFQELALMCRRMFPEESDEVENYVGRLPNMIQGSVMASKPKIMQDAIEFVTELMDQKIYTFADRQAENKRKLDDNSRNNQNQQQPFKRQNVAKAYTVGPGEKKVYGVSKPLYLKCNYLYDGQCAPKCNNCKIAGHLARDCRSPAATDNNQRGPVVNQRVVTCFECRVQGHYNRGN
uniref:CCHC-type domain-containing protein n=1 Tax=Tanacetum cinerariifolium TaxID=118510 RepID=A0A6L2LRH3_TANCI|nr:hypothetical protein [Tanacetum cinerariifolium]